ncbi:hypothetical protein [Streptomyces sp. JH34]|uniref:hypothetical protein n=1 Tax=Streptomyces sp. JH34 TaxID=2793633 RepID=UPI0023F89656|nr:hypothetical protein [Streptomyces sp. JH34]MDF6022542.1 hypothetical protein [Streptomyces sp. JH34]
MIDTRDPSSADRLSPARPGLDCAPAVNHQPEYTAACITPAADRAVLDGAVAMAWTATGLSAASRASRS